jgi:hypothetical protein
MQWLQWYPQTSGEGGGKWGMGEGERGRLMQKPHMDFGMRDDSVLLIFIWKSVNMSSMVCDYITVRTTQLYRPCIMIFIQFYYMFRLSISAIFRYEYWLIKTAKRGQVSAYRQWI